MLLLKSMKNYLMLKTMNRLAIFLAILTISSSSYAANNRNVPRFVTTKSDHVNARKGPGVTYPINWVLVRKSEPLKVIAEFEDWRKTEDMNGYVGWVHSSVLSTKRSVIVTCKDSCNLLKSNSKTSSVVAKLEEGVRCSLEKTKYSFCKIKCKGHKGWLEHRNIWGLLKEEISDG